MFIDAPVALTLVVGLAGPYTQTVDELPGSGSRFFDQHRTKSTDWSRTSCGIHCPYRKLRLAHHNSCRIHITMLHGLSSLGVHLNIFGPTSVQFKSEINDAFPRKRHQKRHLEFCTAHLLSRMLWVRIPPGAPLPFSFNDLCERVTVCFFDGWSG
jgi:hypothetical protein